MDDIQSWWEVPSIAHFCSLFRAAFNLLDFDIEELEEALLTDGAEDSGSSLLQELMVRLLAGCVPSAQGCISIFNYQMFLRRLFRQKCQEYGRDNPFNTDMDFQFLPLRSKVEILHALCDFRLDADDVQDLLKKKDEECNGCVTAANHHQLQISGFPHLLRLEKSFDGFIEGENLESDSLRVEPLGHDESNSAYWYFYGTRLYREDYPKPKKSMQERKRKIRDDKRKRTRRKKKKGAAATEDEEEEEEDEAASDGENDDALLKSRTGAGVRWQVVCFSESDWEALTERLHGSTSPPERALHRTLAEDFLPEIPRLFAEKERLQRKRMQESQPRRTSGRIEKLRKQQQREAAMMEEEERSLSSRNALAKINEDSLEEMFNEKTVVSANDEDQDLDDSKEEESKVIDDEEKERLFQCYLAREERMTRAFLRSLSKVQGERIVLGSHLREESSSESSVEDACERKRRKSPRVKRKEKHRGRSRGSGSGNRSEASKDGLPVGRQTNNSLSSATGPIIIQTSRRKLKTSQVKFRQSDEDLQTGLHKILERVKSHEDAWPFADPVDEKWAPRYYAVVRKPMHLRRMEEKLEAGEYLSFSHFKADFMQIVENCRKYNGSDNEYTEMVENLKEVFQRAADRYLESDLSSDEDVAIEFPPPAGAVPGALPGAKGGAVGGEDVTSPTVKKEEPEEEAEEENEEPKEEALEGRKRRRKRLRGGNSWKESEAKRHTDEDSVEEEEGVKTEVTVKEEKVEKKEDRRRGDKRKSEEKVEEKKEDKKEDRRRKEEEKRKEEEVEKVEKKGKGEKIKEEELKDEEEKLEDTQEELEEERYSSHRKRRKKVSESEGNEKKRKGQRSRRGADTEEEQIEEKKPLSESATHTEEEEEEGNTSGSKKKESATGGKRSKSKPKKTSVVRNAAAIDALAEATEQTLKDINKWLDETPRLSEFSSASNSPSHLMSAEEYDAVGKGIESEYRKSLRMCDPTFGEFQQKDHGRKDSGPGVDKKGVRVDKRKPGQGAGAASSVSVPKRTIIERLQPGKSKGNLLKQGRSNSDADSSGGSGGVVGSGNVADEPSKKPGEATPKLSLGTVLRGDIAFGEGTKKEPEEVGDEEEEEKTSLAGGNLKKEKKLEEEKVEVEEKVEEDKPVRKKMGSATPNLSAWFKAFGAPRGQGQKKKGPDESKGNTSQDEGEKVAGSEEPKLADEGRKTLPEDDTVAGKVDPEPLSPSPSGTPHSTSSRQRHVSTGSSNVSDLSSAFSPDVQDPALSPRLVELPSHSPSASAPLPIPSTYAPVNGTIRVGFYQDTSQKSGGSFSSNGGAEEGLPSPTHSGSSVLPTVPMQSSDMQFYDTSKPLTDQYREVAARVHHQHQHPPTVPTPPPVSPSPPASASPPRPMPYPNTPSVIFSTGSNRVTSPTYLPPVYPPPTSNTITSYAPTVTTTTNSFSASESGPATTFPVKKRLYATASTSSSGSTSITESSGTSVLVAPTCSSPVGRSYHSPEPQVSVVQHTTPLVRTDSPPPYDCSTTGTVPGYPHAHLETSQPKLGFARLPIYHHHPELSPLNPQHPGKPEPLRSVLHHPSMSPRTSDVQPSSPPRTIEPIIPPYPVEHQRRVLDLTGSVPAMQPTPAPPARTKTKTTRKTKTGRQQQQQRQEPSELPVEPPGFQQFTRKSPEPLAAGLQQPQHPSSSAFEFAARLSLYGRDGKNFQHLYRAPIAPPSTGYYVDPGSMVKSPPPPSHQQPQPQHSQPLTQGCPPQGTVGSALPSYPFPISPHYPHYHPHHRLDTVPPKSQYLPSSPPPPSSSASPTSVPSSSPTTSASPIPAPSIPASLLSSAPPSFHPSNLSPLPTLPGHRTFCTTGNGRASGSRLLAFPQGQQREGGSIVPGGSPLLVDPASPLYQQYHHHSHPHLHPPTHHLPQEELLLRGAAPLAPYSTSGYQHAFDPINRPWH